MRVKTLVVVLWHPMMAQRAPKGYYYGGGYFGRFSASESHLSTYCLFTVLLHWPEAGCVIAFRSGLMVILWLRNLKSLRSILDYAQAHRRSRRMRHITTKNATITRSVFSDLWSRSLTRRRSMRPF